MKKKHSSRTNTSAFTIVELLIVIVVIAILAAISIVAYNGIQERARASSVSTALSQASKKLALLLVDDTTYPATPAAFFTEIGANSSGVKGDITYQYSVNNTTDPKTYCITATNGTTSYKTTQSSSPASGGCNGHGQGGVAAITNLVTNPSFETNVASWSVYTGLNAPTRVTTNAWSGTARLSAVGNNTVTTPRMAFYLPVSVGDTISASARVRSDGQTPTNGFFVVKTRLAGVENGTLIAINPAWAPGGDGWQQLTTTFTVPANTDSVAISPGVSTAVNYTGTFGLDGVIAVKSASVPTFADGNSPNWDWTSTVNNSTSTGPPL